LPFKQYFGAFFNTTNALTGTSSTLATDITDAGTNLFITSTNDWASVDVNGALRMAAWKDGGANQ
jgi:hypothetical protein